MSASPTAPPSDQMEESDLFDAFDDAPPPPSKRSRLVTPPDATQPRASDDGGLPAVLCHLHSEAIASLRMHGLDDESCWRLEQILRESDVVPRAAPSTETASIIAAAGSVHYFSALPDTASACPQPVLTRELPFLLAQSLLSPIMRALRASRPPCARHVHSMIDCPSQGRSLCRC